jgi:LysM repeat protein
MSLSANLASSGIALARYFSADLAASPHPDDPSEATYEVACGDTIDSVAQTAGVDPQALLDANPQVINPQVLYPGDVLQLPTTSPPVAPTTTSHGHDEPVSPTTTPGTADGTALDPTRLPIGDGKYSYTSAQTGYIYLDRNSSNINPNNPAGSSTNGPWIRSDGTYDSTNKAVVEGEVEWPSETEMTVSPDGQTRTIYTNDLPGTSGVFPIASSSEAYQYDQNPNTIQVQSLSVDLPTNPVANDYSTPVTGGAVGFIYTDESKTSMTALFAAVDEKGNDAVAHEVQDSNKGHPQQSGEYHFHSAPEALKDAEGIIGYALDGFPIMGSVENGQKVTNADLDENHGKYTTIQVDGQDVQTYAYYATDEFPYTIGAFKGTPAVVEGEIAPSQPAATLSTAGDPMQLPTVEPTRPGTGGPMQPSAEMVSHATTGSPPAGGSDTSHSVFDDPQQVQKAVELLISFFSAMQEFLEGSQTSSQDVQPASQVDQTTSQGNPVPAQETQPQMPATQPPEQATQPQPQGTQPLPQGTQPPPQGSEPPPQGTQPPPQGTQPPPQGTQPPPQGAQPPAQG